MATFTVRYEISDGYVGSRPHSFCIEASDFEEGMDDAAIENLIHEMAHEDMLQNVSAGVVNLSEVVAFVRQNINSNEQ